MASKRKRSPVKKTPVIKSWVGFETERSEVRRLAEAYFRADRNIDPNLRPMQAIAGTVQGFRGLRTDPEDPFTVSGQALKALVDYSKVLHQDRHLDFDLIRDEWVEVLNRRT